MTELSKTEQQATPKAKSDDPEQAALDRLVVQHQTRAPIALKLEFDPETRSVECRYNHPDAIKAAAMVMEDLATTDIGFYQGLLNQLIEVGAPGEPVSQTATNFALSTIRAINPKDEIETMLAAQMAAVHQATMFTARRLNFVETLPQLEANERAFNKLARTFTTQMEALRKHRNGGKQTVTVQHVNVEDGGQAIVGNVQTGGGGQG